MNNIQEIAENNPTKGARGAPVGNQNATKHGLYVAKRLMTELGSRVIDGRSTAGRALTQWREELTRDLGGESALSAQQQTLIELAIREKFILDSVDCWLFEQRSMVNARSKTVHPIVLQRQTVADSLKRTLGQLGLKRQAKPLNLAAEFAKLIHDQPKPSAHADVHDADNVSVTLERDAPEANP